MAAASFTRIAGALVCILALAIVVGLVAVGRFRRAAPKTPVADRVTVNFHEIPETVTIIGKLGLPLYKLVTVRGRWVKVPAGKEEQRFFRVDTVDGERVDPPVDFARVQQMGAGLPDGIPLTGNIPSELDQEIELRGFEAGGFSGLPEPVMEECRRLIPGFAHWTAVQDADFEPPFSTTLSVIAWERKD